MRAGGRLHCLLQEVFERYGRPLYLTETSHVGDGRAAWLRELSDEVHVAIEGGVPILGVCLYPILDRCGWDDPAIGITAACGTCRPTSTGGYVGS